MPPLNFLNGHAQTHNGDRLRKQLQCVERRILRITGMDSGSWRWTRSQKKCEQVGLLIWKRQKLLNKMVIGTPEEVARMEQVNARLRDLTKRMYHRCAELYRKVLTATYDETFDVDVMVEGSLTYGCNDDESVLDMTNDHYYGSDFRKMLSIIDLLYLYRCEEFKIKEIEETGRSINLNDHPDMSDEELGFEDYLNGKDTENWESVTFRGRYPAFKPIRICHAIHTICDHQPYSIPDLLRMNDFSCEVKVTHQHLVKQDGSRGELSQPDV